MHNSQYKYTKYDLLRAFIVQHECLYHLLFGTLYSQIYVFYNIVRCDTYSMVLHEKVMHLAPYLCVCVCVCVSTVLNVP